MTDTSSPGSTDGTTGPDLTDVPPPVLGPAPTCTAILTGGHLDGDVHQLAGDEHGAPYAARIYAICDREPDPVTGGLAVHPVEYTATGTRDSNGRWTYVPADDTEAPDKP